MILLNKLLAKVDLALIKRSRISKAEKEVREIKTLRKELQQARKEAHEAGLLSQKAQKASMSLEQRLLSLPLLRPAGFPPHTTQIALILYAKDLNKVTEVMAAQPQCRLEHIALIDAKQDSPLHIPFIDKDGSRAVPVGKLETLKQYVQLELVFYQPEFNRFRHMQAINALQALNLHTAYITAPPTGWSALYLPHHYTTWKKQFNELHAMLEDVESKQILAQILKARITGNTGYYGLSDYPQYFHPVMPVRHGDVIFDAGAYGAQPAITFAELAGGTGHVLAFEPEPEAYIQAAQKLLPHANTTLLPFGVWRKHETLFFHSQETGGSHIAVENHKNNCIKVPVTTIDTVVHQRKLHRLDLIKMDIEGAETAALEGAVETLRRYKPNLTICLYHNETDVIEIPAFIKKLNLGYKMYMGHHSALRHDTTLYATAR